MGTWHLHAHACTCTGECTRAMPRARAHTQAFRSAYGFHIFLNRAVYRAATKNEALERETHHI